jgi:hypothetical protein
LLGDFASVGEPDAVEAKQELFRIVAAMRGEHGPKLRDIPGRVLYGTANRPLNEHGQPHHAPIPSRWDAILAGDWLENVCFLIMYPHCLQV